MDPSFSEYLSIEIISRPTAFPGRLVCSTGLLETTHNNNDRRRVMGLIVLLNGDRITAADCAAMQHGRVDTSIEFIMLRHCPQDARIFGQIPLG